MILLYHETGRDAHISTPARVGRDSHPARHYQAQGHVLVLDGPGHIVAHDAEEICKIPGWRMATPQECDAYYAAQRKASGLHEADLTESEDDTGEIEDEPGNEGQQANKTTANSWYSSWQNRR